MTWAKVDLLLVTSKGTNLFPAFWCRKCPFDHQKWIWKLYFKYCLVNWIHFTWIWMKNKANLRDLIAATGLVILLKLDLNRRFFSPCDRAILSFVYHFVAIGEFKLELQSGNGQSGSNVTLLEPCDLEIWLMTLKNNRAPLLCYFKPCASFRSHWWIQTGVTVQKRPIWVKFNAF